MRVMIMGAGGQGAPCASIFSRDPEVTAIKLCDINEELLLRVKKRIKSDKISIWKVDASKVEEVAAAAKDVDVIVDLTTMLFAERIMEAAVKAQVHYVNTAWDEDLYRGFREHFAPMGTKPYLFDEFEKIGKTALVGCGMTPGYGSNIPTKYYADKMDSLESVKIRLAKRDASISKEEEILHPWNPGWSPRQALLDFVEPAYKSEDGKYVKMEEYFSEPEVWEFPEPIGRELVAHHAHEEPVSYPQVFREKGLKYCDFKYYVNKQIAPVVAMGLGQEEEIEIKGKRVSPLETVLACVPKPEDAFLSEDPSQFEYQDKTKFVSIMLEIKGTKDGRKVTYGITIPTINAPRQRMYDLYGTSIISVALPVAIGAKMAVEGTKNGVIHPEEMDAERYLHLLEASGYPNKWEEKVIWEE